MPNQTTSTAEEGETSDKLTAEKIYNKFANRFHAAAQGMAEWECSKKKYFYDNYVDRTDKSHQLEHGQIIKGLLHYFLKDEVNAAKYGIDTRKSIRLVGNTGSGKTMLMRIFQAVRLQVFEIKSAREIVEEYNQDGSAIVKYGVKRVIPTKDGKTIALKHICIDDIGKETFGGHYSKKNKNVIGEIIDSSYDNWIRHGVHTHMTDNLADDQLERIYGDRNAGRIFQMTNKIILGGDVDSVDFRRM